MADDIALGLIGCGHWGPNYARLLQNTQQGHLQVCVDLDPERLAAMKQRFPGVETLDHPDKLWSKSLDGVIIATPASSHYLLVKRALEQGLHVLCEKPLTLSSRESHELTALSEDKGLILMVGHTFLFHSGIQKLKDYLQQDLLGEIYYLHAMRSNLGPVRQDVNALWDLAAHDISIFNYLLGEVPMAVSARGQAYLQAGIEDMGFISLNYSGKMMAHIHVSWLYPIKIRQLTIVGSKKMVLWDDMNSFEPIRIYDAAITQEPFYQDFGQFQLLPKQGDTTIPRIYLKEPLRELLDCFLKGIRTGVLEQSDGLFSTQVVQTLEALDLSLKAEGKKIILHSL